MNSTESRMMSSQITRRTLLKQLALWGAALAVRQKAVAVDSDQLDRFGGLKSVGFEASGYFRVEKGDRWWFVTPEGNAFLSFGLNHPGEDYITQSYNVDFWKKQFGVSDVSEPGFREGFTQKVMEDLKRFGMNSLGTHSRKERFSSLTVPYVQGLFFVKTPYWMAPDKEKFVDVFSPDFEQQSNRIAQRTIRPRSEDPYLLGYTFTDCPILTDLDADAHGQVSYGRAQPDLPTWPRVLRNLRHRSPGKQVYVDSVRKKYSNMAAFNKGYRTEFSSFEALLNAEDWSPVTRSHAVDDTADNHGFLLKIMDRYYQVATAAIRRVDQNHLIFGDILNAQTGVPDYIVSLVSRYADLIAYQYYGKYEEHRHIIDQWSRISGKPLYHTDTSFCVPYEQMPDPIGAMCNSTQERAEKFYECASQTLNRPDVIGYNWCGWMDMWAEWKSDRQHTGLQNPFGSYHDPMPETMPRLGSRLYEIGLSHRK